MGGNGTETLSPVHTHPTAALGLSPPLCAQSPAVTHQGNGCSRPSGNTVQPLCFILMVTAEPARLDIHCVLEAWPNRLEGEEPEWISEVTAEQQSMAGEEKCSNPTRS